MTMKSVLGLAAVAGLLVIAAPTERANAAPLGNPGIAAALQNEGKLTTEVRWHRHWGWRRHHWRRHYWHRRHWHRHHWRRW